MSDNLEEVIGWAEAEKPSYTELTRVLVEQEIAHRKQKDMERRTKMARLPLNYNLDNYDFSMAGGLDKRQFNQLRDTY